MTQESNAKPMLHEAETSDDVRSLLSFARAQGPGPGDLDRLAKRLSPLVGVAVSDLSGPADLGLGTAPANPAGMGPTLAAAGKGTLIKVGMSTLTKAIVAASIVSAGAVWWALPRAPVTPAARPIVKVAASAQEPAPAPPQAVEPAEPAPVAEPVVQPRAVRARAAAPKPALEAASEIELIRRAEDLRNQPSQALRTLSQHGKLYPNGMLAQEREVLAIEALLASGKRAEAEARAARLAASHPGSAHLRRVRVLLGAGNGE